MSFSPTNQPTNLEPPTEYYSLRVTTSDMDLVVNHVLFDIDSYIMYPHTGKNDLDPNPHYHILILGKVPVERLRKRVRDHIGAGNKFFSGKSNSNGLLSGISYCTHEDTKPIFKGPEPWELWIQEAPKWEPRPLVQTKIGETRKPVHPDHFREITFRNMLKVCLRHRQDRHLKTKSLAVVLESLHHDGWFLNVQVIRQGIPSTFYDEFEARCSGDTVMREGRFNRMRVVSSWEGGRDF